MLSDLAEIKKIDIIFGENKSTNKQKKINKQLQNQIMKQYEKNVEKIKYKDLMRNNRTSI